MSYWLTELNRLHSKLKRISEHCCSACMYDEAGGALENHCPKCCHYITTQLWKLTHSVKRVAKPKPKPRKKA